MLHNMRLRCIKNLTHFSALVFPFSLLWTLRTGPLPTTVCTLHPTYTFHTLNRTIRSVMQDVLRFDTIYATSKTVKGLGFRNSIRSMDNIRSLYFLLLIFYMVLTVHSRKGKSALQTINKRLQGALLFVYFVIDTIFILGDGLTRLLLR
jgi:hypothetical protein